MKHVLIIALALGAFLFTACNSTPGSTGATGPAGQTGPQGPSGTNGTNGNANVQQYIFGSRTITTQTTYTIPGVTQAQLDSSIILAYHQSANGYWFAVPGPSGGSYSTKTFMEISQGLRYEVALLSFTGGSYDTPTTWASFRIIIVPASTVTTLSAKDIGINYSDYNAVRKHYNLPE
jgi:hypothetical protein